MVAGAQLECDRVCNMPSSWDAAPQRDSISDKKREKERQNVMLIPTAANSDLI